MSEESGREHLTLSERADLMAAEIVQLQASSPTGFGHDVHQFNQLLGNMQACVKHCRLGNPALWGIVNLSKTELRVLAWRRGGVMAYDEETDRLYDESLWQELQQAQAALRSVELMRGQYDADRCTEIECQLVAHAATLERK